MANYVIINGDKWEFLISNNIIKLKIQKINDATSIKILFNYLNKNILQKNNDSRLKSAKWELKQISYGKRAKERNKCLDIIYDSLYENTFVDKNNKCVIYSTKYVRRPEYEKDFESFILKAIN